MEQKESGLPDEGYISPLRNETNLAGEANEMIDGSPQSLVDDYLNQTDPGHLPSETTREKSKKWAELDITFAALMGKYGKRQEVQSRLDRLKAPNIQTISGTNHASDYSTSIGQYRLLTPDDEFELFTSMNDSLQKLGITRLISELELSPEEQKAAIDLVVAYQTVYLSNLRLVASIARVYTKSGLPIMDLIQEGNIGLAKAITRFDIQKGYKFSTYASKWIHQKIKRAIGDNSRTIRIPVHKHEKWGTALREIDKLANKLGRDPTPQELAEYTKKDPDQLRQLMAMGRLSLTSLDTSSFDGEKLTDTQSSFDGVTEIIDQLAAQEVLVKIFETCKLTPREKLIVCLHHGLDLHELSGQTIEGIPYDDVVSYGETQTFEHIGKLLKKTRQRIRQIDLKVIKQMKEHLGQIDA